MSIEKPVANLEKYINIDEGLARIRGNKPVYKRLLGTFKDSLQYDQLFEAVSTGDRETALRVVHDIKGVTANLSLTAAYEKTLEVESRLKGDSLEQDDLTDLGEVLRITLLCIDYVVDTL